MIAESDILLDIDPDDLYQDETGQENANTQPLEAVAMDIFEAKKGRTTSSTDPDDGEIDWSRSFYPRFLQRSEKMQMLP